MKAPYNRAILVILVLAFVLAWLVFDQTAKANPIRDSVSRVVSPIQFSLQRLSSPVRNLLTGLGHVAKGDSQADRLRQEITELRNQLVLLREAQIENETLRRQLSFKRTVPSFQLLSAEVIGRDPDNLLQYMIIDRGAGDGVEVGMPVLTADGLVGRIRETSRGAAKVMLITDPSSSVAALIQRTRATGIVQGYPAHGLVMRYIPQGDTVAPGDVVLTSGLGSNFPKRLVVGQVASVRQRDVEVFQEARLVPVVDLYNLEIVMVLLSFTPGDLAGQEIG